MFLKKTLGPLPSKGTKNAKKGGVLGSKLAELVKNMIFRLQKRGFYHCIRQLIYYSF